MFDLLICHLAVAVAEAVQIVGSQSFPGSKTGCLGAIWVIKPGYGIIQDTEIEI